jgi:hypothetical protein
MIATLYPTSHVLSAFAKPESVLISQFPYAEFRRDIFSYEFCHNRRIPRESLAENWIPAEILETQIDITIGDDTPFGTASAKTVVNLSNYSNMSLFV